MSTPTEGPSKRAMELVARWREAGLIYIGEVNAYLLEQHLDAELRKGEELAKAVEAVIHGDYPRPPKNGQCKHGAWSWNGCEACIDDFLEPALAAYRSRS